jgi:hypothetical protein
VAKSPGRVTHTRQVEGQRPDEKQPWSSKLGFGERLRPSSQKTIYVEKSDVGCWMHNLRKGLRKCWKMYRKIYKS